MVFNEQERERVHHEMTSLLRAAERVAQGLSWSQAINYERKAGQRGRG